jgi:hypothetical protein
MILHDYKIVRDKTPFYNKNGYYREFIKKGNKIIAYITLNNVNKGYEYTFGKPSDNGNITFSSSHEPFTLEQARDRVFENLWMKSQGY